MVDRIVVISGAVGSGKSQLAESLCARFNGEHYSTRQMLMRRHRGRDDRGDLQKLGEKLDRDSGGSWVRDELSREIWDLKDRDLAVIDAVRTREQIEFLRRSFARRVVHVHVTASDETLRKRYERRRRQRRRAELPSYDEVKANRTEAKIEELARDADVVINSDRSTERDVLVRVARALGLLVGAPAACVDVVVGGGYGSEGKGNIAFYLAPEYDLLVRVGGPNAGHKVYLPDGTVYPHHHLPSGTRAAGSPQLLLAPGSVLRVPKLLDEIAECGVDEERLAIDPQAMIIEDEDIELEAGLRKRIGSTRQGVGFATARRILRDADDRLVPVRLAKDVDDLHAFIRPAHEVLEAAYARGDRIMLEGTQGSGLSVYHGPYPHVTSRETGAAGALAESGISPRHVRRIVLVVRTLPIRVKNPPGGTSGPLSQELKWKDVEARAGFKPSELSSKEKTTTTGTQRRVGEFEWDLLRRSALINGPTDIALTFTDYISRDNAHARRFELLTPETINFIEEVERVAGAPVTMVSTGFDRRPSIVDRRAW
jgi:adenylosuccinate synthase